MSSKNAKAPRLPAAPVEYDQQFMDSLLGILRQYFNQLDNNGPIAVSTQRLSASGSTPAQVISAISCIQPSTTGTSTVLSLPSDLEFSSLRSGDIYYDRSGGAATSYPLRIKA